MTFEYERDFSIRSWWTTNRPSSQRARRICTLISSHHSATSSPIMVSELHAPTNHLWFASSMFLASTWVNYVESLAMATTSHTMILLCPPERYVSCITKSLKSFWVRGNGYSWKPYGHQSSRSNRSIVRSLKGNASIREVHFRKELTRYRFFRTGITDD